MKLSRWFSDVFFVFFIFGASLVEQGFAAESNLIKDVDYKPRYEWLSLRTNIIYAKYFTGEVTSGSLFWTPGVRFGEDWGFRLQLGASLLKDANRSQPSLFFAPEIQLLTSYRPFWNFLIEAGGGYQKWVVEDGTTNPILSANLHYQFPGRLLKVVDSIFIGYSITYELISHDQIRIGTQITF